MKQIVYDIMQKLKPVVEADPYINKVILFGSQARKQARIWSDVDIAIVCDDPKLVNRRAIRTVDDFEADINFVYTTNENLLTTNIWDVNYYIREDGIELWQRQEHTNI